MAWDEGRQRVALFGGNGDDGPVHDVWDWDGSAWTQHAPGPVPAPGGRHGMAYDRRHARFVLFGAASPPGASSMTDTWLYGALTPATNQPLGTACRGTSGLPILTTNDPVLGNPGFTLDLLSARPSSLCVFALSANPQTLALGGGCTLYLEEPLIPLPALSNGAGFATARLTLPLEVAWRGLPLYAQAVVADPLGPVFGLAFSAGRTLRVGD